MRCSSCQSVFSILWAIRGCYSPFPPHLGWGPGIVGPRTICMS